jgi:diguanylate cyclase (GGDEF)-like protein
VLYFILLIAIGNLVLGYALAVKLEPLRAAAQTPQRPAPRPTVAVGPPPVERAAEGPPAAAKADPSPRDRSLVETSVEDFLAGLQRFREEVTRLDHRVRRRADEPDAEELEDCAAALRAASDQYLEETRHTADQFGDGDDSGPVGQKVRAAIDAQSRQVQSTRDCLDELRLSEDIEGGCRRLLDQTSGLAEGSDRLQQQLEEARLDIARSEGRLDQLDENMLTDDLTQLATRAALEAAILEQWRIDPEREQSQIVGLIDVDHCARLNEEQGRKVCDNVLRAIARLVADTAGPDTQVARFGGQKFALLMVGGAPSQAVAEVERMRQLLQAATFDRGGAALRVTASCALARVKREDTLETLFERLAHTLGESKQYGRNRTFLHEGNTPAPVAPMSLQIEAGKYEV